MINKKKKTAPRSTKKDEKSRTEAIEMIEKGDMLGDSLMGMFAMFATSWKGMGIAAYALARTWAALQAVAEKEGVNVKGMFDDFSKSFKAEFDDELLKNGFAG